MWMRLFLPFLLLGLATPTTAQVERPTNLEQSISVGYVLIPFVATDATGHPIRSLAAKDVTLLVDGAPVKFGSLDRVDNAPISFTILVDGSGSMALAGKLEDARAGVRELISQHVAGDEYALFLFAESKVQELVPVTIDGSAILRAIDGIRPYGKTAFFDALAEIRNKTLLGNNGSRVIVLLTDGLDNASTLARSDLDRMLEGISVPVYPLALRTESAVDEGSSGETLVDMDILREIASASGGRLMVGEDPDRLRAAIREIVSDLRSGFVIGFTPTGHGGVQYRRIEVRLKGRARHVQVKAGYRGTDPPLVSSQIRTGGAVSTPE
jgi:VWFA-related protein